MIGPEDHPARIQRPDDSKDRACKIVG